MQEAVERWAQSHSELEAWVKTNPDARLVVRIKDTIRAINEGTTPELESELARLASMALKLIREAPPQLAPVRVAAGLETENLNLRAIIALIKTPDFEEMREVLIRSLTTKDGREFLPHWFTGEIPSNWDSIRSNSTIKILVDHFARAAFVHTAAALREQKVAHLEILDRTMAERARLLGEANATDGQTDGAEPDVVV